MEFDLDNWTDKNFYSRKLPKEEDIESFFQCISIQPKTKSFFQEISNHDYSIPARHSYRRETFPVLTPTSDSDTWIVPHLSPCQLVEHPETPAPRMLPSLAFQLGSDISNRISKIHHDYCFTREIDIKATRDISSIRNNIVNNTYQNLSTEIENFKKELKDKKYIQFLSHQEILAKTNKLRESFPLEPIYILADEELLNYLYAHTQYSNGQLLKNVWLIKNSYNQYGASANDSFGTYKSAIFTTAQMKGSHSFEIYYSYQRGNRIWKIFFSIIFNLKLDIPEDPLEGEVNDIGNKSLNNSHPRWDKIL